MKDETKRFLSGALVLGAAFLLGCGRGDGTAREQSPENPVFPLSETLADINIDGIGREDTKRPDLRGFVHLYLSRNGKAALQETKARAVGLLATRLRFEHRDNYAGSDHAIFEDRLIPAVAFSTGHPKEHHQPTDTADKLDYGNIRDIARLAFAMAWEIAAGERKIERIISE